MSKKKKQEEVTQAPATIKVVEKKRGGCGTFFLGFIFCFIFLFVAIGGTGLYLYYNLTLRQIENTIGVDLSFIDTSLHDYSLKELLNLGLNEKDKITEATLESLNADFDLQLPETIPGTQLNIAPVYNEVIAFQGQQVQVKKIRIQDIINNLDEFVSAVLPKVYDHATVQQVVDTLQTTILDDLNYPALNGEYYNIGTTEQPNYKKLADLTITQALEQLPAHFGSENLTVQELANAAGLSLFPDVEPGQDDIYAELKALNVTQMTTEDLTTSITGEILVNLVDLSAYDFTQTEEFYNTNLNDLGNYFLTLSLGQFITAEGVATDAETMFAKPEFINIPRDTKLINFKATADALTLSQIFSAEDLEKLSPEQQGLTVAEYLNSYGGENTFAVASGIDCSSYSGYVALFGNTTATTYAETMASASTYEYLGNDNVTAIAGIADLTLQEITESDDAISLMLENFGTLGDLLGGEQTGLFGIISEVQIADLLNDASTAIQNALTGEKAQTTTLDSLLGADSSSDPLIGRVMTVTVSELFGGDPGTAIKNKLIGTEGNYTTLGELLNIQAGTGQNATFIEIIANLTMKDLIGEGANAGAVIEGAVSDIIDTVTLADVFSAKEAAANRVLNELYNLANYPNGALPIKDIPAQINNVHLSAVVGENKPKIFNLLVNYDALTLSTLDKMQLKTNITINDLIGAGVIENSPNYDKTIAGTRIRDMSLEAVLEIVGQSAK